MTAPTSGAQSDPNVVIVGGGHNALVAATYLARAGVPVTVLEQTDRFGGAVQSRAGLRGRGRTPVAVLLPRVVAAAVDRRRPRAGPGAALPPGGVVHAFAPPAGGNGLLVERTPGDATRESFRALTGSDDEWHGWQDLESQLGRFARAIAPTLTGPLPTEAALRAVYGDDQLWNALTRHPIGGPDRGRAGQRPGPRSGADRRPDRHLRPGTRPVAAAEPVLRVPRDRRRDRGVEGAGRRHGSGRRGAGARGPGGRCRADRRVPGGRDPEGRRGAAGPSSRRTVRRAGLRTSWPVVRRTSSTGYAPGRATSRPAARPRSISCCAGCRGSCPASTRRPASPGRCT